MKVNSIKNWKIYESKIVAVCGKILFLLISYQKYVIFMWSFIFEQQFIKIIHLNLLYEIKEINEFNIILYNKFDLIIIIKLKFVNKKEEEKKLFSIKIKNFHFFHQL